ncbi:alpha beta-hydrolase [Coniophora puteana RWD-64-598 SS2]|uniref:Alpha beta-hydrolase n=1 Tax=Coniophora puteana (strain RWD-64-598) TaxID=741705 RepID=R7SDK0_CONPW|nr:alpha beta-hydrolase [Coniophora puteana RWD-64-598 SS2]EIW74221.1 alpha beta-hydrolase [Coniophora puteana RWD-64-598 SS2]
MEATSTSKTNDVTSAQYASFFDPSTRTRSGLCPVTLIQTGTSAGKESHVPSPLESHELYFEMHGHGPTKVVFIMGLNNTSFGWAPQVDHFAKLADGAKYTVLVFDNRGVGNSGSPMGPYTTSGMARDVVALLDFVGWTEERSVNVVGISMGGMIGQELATQIPERIVSLTLAVSKAGESRWGNLSSWGNFSTLLKAMTTTDPKIKVPLIMGLLFPDAWLNEIAEGDPEGRTNLEVQTSVYTRRLAITRPQPPLGSLSQFAATITHYVSPARLRTISSSIPKVLIVAGDSDKLVDPRNSTLMKERMPEAELVVFEQTGHGISAQRKERFNALLERVFAEGAAKAGQGGGVGVA